MIKADFNKTHMEGSLPMLCSEMEGLVKSFKEMLIKHLGEDAGEEMLQEVLANGQKSDEELKKDFEEIKKKMPEELKKAIKKEALKVLYDALTKEVEEDE